MESGGFSFGSREEWVKFLEDPTTVIAHVYAKGASTSRDPLEVHKTLSTALDKVQKDGQLWEDIPLINRLKTLDSLKSRTVVRFRCMIQDMFDPEFYLAAYDKSGRLGFGMYQDRLENAGDGDGGNVDFNSPSSITQSRMSYFCISVPGENEWVRQKWDIQSGVSLHAAVVDEISDAAAEPSTKDEEMPKAIHLNASPDVADSVVKRVKGEDTADGKQQSGSDEEVEAKAKKIEIDYARKLNLCFPACDVNPNRRACIVKVYDQQLLDEPASLKLNDVVEVVGIIQFDSPIETAIAAENLANGEERLEYVNALIKDMDLDDRDSHYPSSLVPRIHAFSCRKINHINPLLKITRDINENTAETHPKEYFSKIRGELHAILAQTMFGDDLAADYLLCNLISSIYSRRDVLSLGYFPLNVSNLPRMGAADLKVYVMSLYNLLKKLQTHTIYMPLALENLNKSVFVPEKDYTNNKLNSGLLQLPSGTFMLVDETSMAPGQLAAEGVTNLNTVGELLKWQKVKYDFKYHQMEMDTNIRMLVLSEGKSLLPTAFKVPLKCTPSIPVAEMFSAINEYLDEHLQDGIRTYLTILGQERPYSLPDEVQQKIQEDFVEMRQNSEKVSPDTLHSLLTLARLLALSHGDTQLSPDVWEKAKQMEKERCKRGQ